MLNCMSWIGISSSENSKSTLLCNEYILNKVFKQKYFALTLFTEQRYFKNVLSHQREEREHCLLVYWYLLTMAGLIKCIKSIKGVIDRTKITPLYSTIEKICEFSSKDNAETSTHGINTNGLINRSEKKINYNINIKFFEINVNKGKNLRN
ncbi:unnamed protein product [Meganyctiphanes norvegica]|uniref:Uncharacterized protein n=1 Tax=Meganyctiphanes norvegica TaxID=48144 RepID=A0AAV2Q5Z8_MEGNR